MNTLEYNTKRTKLIIPEYGRHIHQMIDQAVAQKDKEERNKMAKAIIGVLPINIINKNIYLLNHVTKIQNKISNSILKLFSERIILETMIVDWKNEGKSKAFNKKLLDFKILKEFNKILFGGITDINQIKNLMNTKNINAICIGNSLNYTENSISIISSNISTRQVSL